MPKHSLVGYSLHLEDRYTRGEKQRHIMAPMPHGAGDLLMAVSAYFESFNGVLGSHKDHHFGEVSNISRLGRSISAQMNTGKSGLESDISDPARPQEAIFKRERRHVERHPVRQMVVVPRGSLTAYWLFESIGNRTLGAQYRQQFIRNFTARYKNLSPVFEQLILEEAWDKYAQDESAYVEQIRVVRTRAARDRTAAMGIGGSPGRYIELLDTTDNPQGAKTMLGKIRQALFRKKDGQWIPNDPTVTEVSATVIAGGKQHEVLVERDKPAVQRIPLTTEDEPPPGDDLFYSEAHKWIVELAARDDVTLPSGWRASPWEHSAAYGRLGAQDAAIITEVADETHRHGGGAESSSRDAHNVTAR